MLRRRTAFPQLAVVGQQVHGLLLGAARKVGIDERRLTGHLGLEGGHQALPFIAVQFFRLRQGQHGLRLLPGVQPDGFRVLQHVQGLLDDDGAQDEPVSRSQPVSDESVERLVQLTQVTLGFWPTLACLLQLVLAGQEVQSDVGVQHPGCRRFIRMNAKVWGACAETSSTPCAPPAPRRPSSMAWRMVASSRNRRARTRRPTSLRVVRFGNTRSLTPPRPTTSISTWSPPPGRAARGPL